MMISDPVSYTIGRPWQPTQFNSVVHDGRIIYSGTSPHLGHLLTSAKHKFIQTQNIDDN